MTLRAVTATLLFAATAALTRAQAPAPAPAPDAVLAALTAAWDAKDAERYLAQWTFASQDDERAERQFLKDRFAKAGKSHLTLPAPAKLAPEIDKLRSYGQLTTIEEPWGRIEQVAFKLEKRGERWTAVAREALDELEGLAHLSLDPQGLAVNGQVLELPDFRLEMRSGTLFTSPAALGRTALVFIGVGEVHFRPSRDAERAQLQKAVGRPEMKEAVRAVFVRIRPADLPERLTGPPLVPDPRAAERWSAARFFYGQHADTTYLLDAPVVGSPWWTIPPAGDALVIFDAGDGPLTFSVSGASAEGISLFDRVRKRQICLYPLPGRPRDFDEDQNQRFDLLHTDVKVTLEPGAHRLSGEASLRFSQQGGGGSLRLRLHEALTIDSVTGTSGRKHLFFRMRNQGTLVVPLSGRGGEETLTIRYHGVLDPPPFEREVVGREEQPEVDVALPLTPPAVYAQPVAWYPLPERDDFATASLQVDVPSSQSVVGPGRRTKAPGARGRTIYSLHLDQPVKQLVFAVGEMVEAGERKEPAVTLSAAAVPRLKGNAKRALAMAARIVRLFTEEFGPPPYSSLQLLLIETRKPGGQSPPGLVIVAERPALLRRMKTNDPANFFEIPGFFLAHEIAHQWWGAGVSPRSYHDRWISEAMAQYAAALWVRHSRGEDAFRGVMKDMARWALEKNDAGPIFMGHRIGHLEGDSRLYRAIVYDKGACVLHTLRRMLGPERFRAGLVSFQERHRFGKAGTTELREALEKAGGSGLETYFEEWVYGTAIPVLSLRSRTDGSGGTFRTTVTVDAERLPGPVPLEIVVEYFGGRTSRVETLPAGGGQWEIETPHPPRRIRINEDAGLLARVRT